MNTIGIALLGLGLVLGGLLFLVVSLFSMQTSDVSRRLQDFVVEDPGLQQRLALEEQMRKAELRGSFSSRVVSPFFKSLGRLLGRMTPATVLEEYDRQMALAGNPMGMGGREFYALRMGFIVIGVFITYLLLRSGITQYSLIAAILTFVIFAYLPKSWLKRKVRRRQDRIRKGLPDALDMLSVCAEAGLGFDQSMQRISENWKTPLGEEMARVVKEEEMGLTRREALRNMADRLLIPELSSFVGVIIQSDQLGMSIAETLYAQAGQMREERRYRAQEQARKLPLKMLFPMLLLIFPALLLVIMGPAIPAFVDFFRTMR